MGISSLWLYSRNHLPLILIINAWNRQRQSVYDRQISLLHSLRSFTENVLLWTPSAKCTRPLFQGRTGCGGRPSGWHDIVTCQRLVEWKFQPIAIL